MAFEERLRMANKAHSGHSNLWESAEALVKYLTRLSELMEPDAPPYDPPQWFKEKYLGVTTPPQSIPDNPAKTDNFPDDADSIAGANPVE